MRHVHPELFLRPRHDRRLGVSGGSNRAPTASGDLAAREAGPADPLGGLGSPRRLATRVGVLVAGVLLVGFAIRALPGLDDIRARLTDASGIGILAVAAFELGSVLGFVAALRGAFSNVPPWRVAAEVGTAEQAANVLLPAGGVGGLALGALIARDFGVPGEIAVTRTVALFLVTSAVTFIAIACGGIFAAFGSGDVPWYGSALPAILAVVVVLAVTSLPRILPAGAKGLRRRISASTRAGVSAAIHLVREPNVTLLGGATTYFALDVGALAAAFHALDAHALAVGPFLLAYTLGQAGGMLPLPGGVGGVDGGLIGMFTLYGTPLEEATAAVLAYRLFQLGLPTICGLFGIAALNRRRRTQRDVPAVAARYKDFLDPTA